MQVLSDLILKKGPLSSVWIAGTAQEKLAKKMVLAADISEIAQRIIDEERINFVLRVSGTLLKGLVIVYSKKTQFMLSDVEDVISKIKLSFKPVSIDLPEGSKGDDAYTIASLSDGSRAEVIMDVKSWLEANKVEDTFLVQPLIIAMSQESQAVEVSATSDSTLSEIDQLPQLDEEVIGFTPIAQPYHETDVAYSPLPPPAFETDGGGWGSDGTSEAVQPEEITPKQKHILDDLVQLSDRPKAHGRKRQYATFERHFPKPLEDLFEEGRKLSIEKNREQDQKQEQLDSDQIDWDRGGGGDDWSDDEPELQRDSFPRPQVGDLGTETGGTSGIQTPVSFLPRRTTPVSTPYIFEPTPRRSAEDSITKATRKVWRDIAEKMGDSEEVTFKDVFSKSSKRYSASAFLQVLVLKTTRSLEVSQLEPFSDIFISRTRNSRDNL